MVGGGGSFRAGGDAEHFSIRLETPQVVENCLKATLVAEVSEIEMPKKRYVLWLPVAMFHVAFPEPPFSTAPIDAFLRSNLTNAIVEAHFEIASVAPLFATTLSFEVIRPRSRSSAFSPPARPLASSAEVRRRRSGLQVFTMFEFAPLCKRAPQTGARTVLPISTALHIQRPVNGTVGGPYSLHRVFTSREGDI